VTVRETAERHAKDVADGNFGRLMLDVAGDALNEVMTLGGPPQPTTKWEILSEDANGNAVRFQMRYSNESAAIELETRWELIDGVWKVVKVAQVAA